TTPEVSRNTGAAQPAIASAAPITAVGNRSLRANAISDIRAECSPGSDMVPSPRLPSGQPLHAVLTVATLGKELLQGGQQSLQLLVEFPRRIDDGHAAAVQAQSGIVRMQQQFRD